MDFTLPGYSDKCHLYIKKSDIDWNFSLFWKILSLPFWLGVISTYLACALTFILLRYTHHSILSNTHNQSSKWTTCLLCRFIGKNKFHGSDDQEAFGILNSLGFVGISLMQREYPVKANNVSSRVLILTILVSTFVTFNSYAANLTSSFATEKFESPINNMNDFNREKTYSLLVWKGSVFHNFLLNSKDNDTVEVRNNRLKVRAILLNKIMNLR